MLKVVGASWQKTRFTTIMLSAVIIIAVFAIFFYEVPLSENDGYYSASVIWSKLHGFREIYWGQNNDPKTVKRGVARAYYKPDMATTGWSTLEIQTQPEYPDWVQAYAAGLLEGSLCWQLIYWHWQNTVATTCETRKDFCENMRKQLQENSENARKIARKNENIPYWHQVNLFYTQLDGLEQGWRHGVIRSRKEKILSIPSIDFLWMNSVSDLKDLEYQYNASRIVERTKPFTSIAFLKYLPNTTNEFLLAHEAAGFYSEMLRLHKCYDFGYHESVSKNSPLIPGRRMVFTSYPAAIYSRDDFYQISGETMLTVVGVGVTNYNKKLWNELFLKNEVLMGPRVIAANRLSKNGKEWKEVIASKNSGTGNKQWLVISESGHSRNTSYPSLTLWVVEQIPGSTFSQNMTHEFIRQGYWLSAGIPFFKEVKTLTGYNLEENDEAKVASELLTPIAKTLTEGAVSVKNVESMMTLMRHPEVAAAGRSDVVLVNVTNGNGTGGIPKVVGDTGFTVYYNYSGKTEDEIKISGHSSNQVDGNHNRGRFHDYFKGMIDEKHAKDRVKSLDDSSKRHAYVVLMDNSLDRDTLISEYAGIIDLKVAEGHKRYKGIAGPPYNSEYKVEPFRWSTSLLQKVPHYGQADLWNFNPDEPQWVW